MPKKKRSKTPPRNADGTFRKRKKARKTKKKTTKRKR